MKNERKAKGKLVFLCYSMLPQLFATLLKDGQQVILFFCTQHLDASLAEVGDTLEDWTGGQMATGMENATEFCGLAFRAHLLCITAFDVDA